MLWLFGACFSRNVFQAARRRLFEGDAEPTAGVGEFLPASWLPSLVAALGDGDIDYAQARFALQSQGEATDNAFIVRVRRKDQRGRSVWRRRSFAMGRNVAEGKRFSFRNQAGK